ncbi:MAG: ABC-F family ATP-binding cassette domain-containing protein [Myxococcota bacterium]|nr:ABC-F family ATP-binding cassette domain-containing protein [Myxococcota bacterium]
MLEIQNITFRIGGRTLFDNASAHIAAGYRVGVVGRNGTGKTTLLKLILGEHELDGGGIHVQANCSVGVVAQEAPGGDQTPLMAVLAADTERAALLAEADMAEDPVRIGDIHTRLVDLDAHQAPARAAAILAGLGFDNEAQHRPLKTFSGGWRMRVALATVLFLKPDLLLLDEPTNHLDLESALWLERHLQTYPATLIAVSHDRNLLTHTADHILHLDQKRLEMFAGGYDVFERTRLARLAQTEALRKRQEADRKRIQSFVDRFRAKATKARQAQSRLKLLERMAPIATIADPSGVVFRFPTPTPASSPLVRLDGVAAAYAPDRVVLTDLHLSVFARDRIALLGTNGNGKTTLARLLSGKLQPHSGQIFRSSKVRIGYFAQDQLDRLDPSLTSLAQLGHYLEDASPTAVRGWLGRFGLGQEKVEIPIAALSGGEKTRLALAISALSNPNLLILDEPTNHLDMDARKALIEALTGYAGAIVLISHDRHLVAATADQLWLVAGGTAAAFWGDLDDYQNQLTESRRASKSRKNPEKKDRKEERKSRAMTRQKLAPIRDRVSQAEARLTALTEEKGSIDAALSDPSTYKDAPERIGELTKRQQILEREIAKAEDDWLDATTALEHALEEDQ